MQAVVTTAEHKVTFASTCCCNEHQKIKKIPQGLKVASGGKGKGPIGKGKGAKSLNKGKKDAENHPHLRLQPLLVPLQT